MDKDGQSGIALLPILEPIPVNGDGDLVSSIVDVLGFQSLTFLLGVVSILDGTHILSVEGGDESDLSDAVELTLEEYINEPFDLVAEETSFYSNKIWKIGITSNYRYYRFKLASSAVTTGIDLVHVTALLSNAIEKPKLQNSTLPAVAS